MIFASLMLRRFKSVSGLSYMPALNRSHEMDSSTKAIVADFLLLRSSPGRCPTSLDGLTALTLGPDLVGIAYDCGTSFAVGTT